MTCRRFGSLTIGETTETVSIAAVGRPRPGALHVRFGPAVTAHRRLDAVKIEKVDDELVFLYGEE